MRDNGCNIVRDFNRESDVIDRAVQRVAHCIEAGYTPDIDIEDMDAVVAWVKAHPLAGQPCPCENSHCPHHDVDGEKFEPCSNYAGGDRLGVDPVMIYLGPCCRPCAEALAAQAPEYVMPPIGTSKEYIG